MIDREKLKSDLKDWQMTITFEKKDGSTRNLKCTLNEAFLPVMDKEKSEGNVRKENPNTLSVWDLENQGWRSFRLDSVQEVLYDAKVVVLT